MIPRLSAMKYIASYRLWLQFEDGSQGEIDLEQELWGEVFEPLRNLAYFRTSNSFRRNGHSIGP